jgi:hypothetical protein
MKISIKSSRFFFTLFLILCGIPLLLFSQNTAPINSNYLFELGISPRVLDIAASGLLQDGSFAENVIIEADDGNTKQLFKMQVIYDPTYKEGMDVRVVYDPANTTKGDIKDLKQMVERSHQFSRMSRDYLVDESTLNLVKDKNGEVVIEYCYQKNDIEPYLKDIKRLKGKVIIKDGELDRIVLTNFKPLKSKVAKMERIVYFEKSNETGGYIKTSSEEILEQIKGDKVIVYTLKTETTDYFTPDAKQLSWENKASVPVLFEDIQTDTLSVKLGWVLPLLGKPATKLGYKLPRPIGLNVFMHQQSQNMQFTDLSAAIDDDEPTSFAGVFALDKSKVKQSTTVSMFKADVWILPFLNIMGIFGTGINNINGDILIGEELSEFLRLLGVPDAAIQRGLNINAEIKSTMYGGGFTLAGAIESWNLSLNYQLLMAELDEVNSKQSAHVFTPMIGYMLPFDMNIMAGVQGQFYDTRVKGFVNLEDGRTLNYNVDFEPLTWNAMFGIYKGFAKHWEIALQAGVGSRTSTTLVFGYRF